MGEPAIKPHSHNSLFLKEDGPNPAVTTIKKPVSAKACETGSIPSIRNRSGRFRGKAHGVQVPDCTVSYTRRPRTAQHSHPLAQTIYGAMYNDFPQRESKSHPTPFLEGSLRREPPLRPHLAGPLCFLSKRGSTPNKDPSKYLAQKVINCQFWGPTIQTRCRPIGLFWKSIILKTGCFERPGIQRPRPGFGI